MNAGLGGTVAIIGTGTIKQIKVAECHAHNLGGPGSVSAVAVLSQP
jgi:hypothetical protein